MPWSVQLTPIVHRYVHRVDRQKPNRKAIQCHRSSHDNKKMRTKWIKFLKCPLRILHLSTNLHYLGYVSINEAHGVAIDLPWCQPVDNTATYCKKLNLQALSMATDKFNWWACKGILISPGGKGEGKAGMKGGSMQLEKVLHLFHLRCERRNRKE